MSVASQLFHGVVLVAAFVLMGLSAAAARFLQPLGLDVESLLQAFLHWCHLQLLGAPALDDLVLIVLLGFLPTGTFLGAVSLGQQWWRTRRVVHSCIRRRLPQLPQRVVRLAERLELGGRLDVVQAAQPYSFCYGLRHPRICLSTALLDVLADSELEAVLLHERHHLRSADPLKVLLVRTLSRTLFFLPVLSELSSHFLIAKELQADRAAIREQGQARALASALCKLVAPPDSQAGAAIASAGSATDARIDQLLHPHARQRVRLSLPALATSAAVVGLVTVATFSPEALGAGTHSHAALGDPAVTCHF